MAVKRDRAREDLNGWFDHETSGPHPIPPQVKMAAGMVFMDGYVSALKSMAEIIATSDSDTDVVGLIIELNAFAVDLQRSVYDQALRRVMDDTQLQEMMGLADMPVKGGRKQ